MAFYLRSYLHVHINKTRAMPLSPAFLKRKREFDAAVPAAKDEIQLIKHSVKISHSDLSFAPFQLPAI